MPEYKIKMEDPDEYILRLEHGIALLQPIAFSLEKSEQMASDYAAALYGALEYLELLAGELSGSLCQVSRQENGKNEMR